MDGAEHRCAGLLDRAYIRTKMPLVFFAFRGHNPRPDHHATPNLLSPMILQPTMTRHMTCSRIQVLVALVLLWLVLLSIDRYGAKTFKLETSTARSTTVERNTPQESIGNLTDARDKDYHGTKRHGIRDSASSVTVGLVDYCVGESYATLKKLIGFNRQAYAAQWNYSIFSGNDDEFPLQTFVEPLAWLKAAYFYQLLSSAQTQEIEWFLWIDCDALITRFDHSVDDILNDLNTTYNHHIVVAQDPHTEFNSGVMFVRNSEWSRDLWKRALQKASDDAIRRHKWWEQQALLEVYRDNQHEETLRILITPYRWKINAFQTFRRNEFNSSSFALHRVNCRKQPECNNLFISFFCIIMSNASFPEELVDCSNATDEFMKSHSK
jgi:hypothetical protein